MGNECARCQACRARQANPPCFGCWIGSAEEKKCKEDVYHAFKHFTEEQTQKIKNTCLSDIDTDELARSFIFGRINPIDKSKESIIEENEKLKAEIRRLKSLAKSNKFFVEKRQDDLMNYQDKQNEEIERLKEKLFVISRPNNDPNFWAKASALWVANEDIKNLKEENKCFKDTFTIDRVNKAAGQCIKMMEAQLAVSGSENKKLRKKARQILDKIGLYKTCLSAKDNLIEAQAKVIKNWEAK